MPETRIDMTILPAIPGYSVLFMHAGMADKIEPYQLHPVVAWRVITMEGKGRSMNGDIWSYAEPLTPVGELADDYMIVRPDGCVEHPLNGTYESVADAIEHYRKDYEA